MCYMHVYALPLPDSQFDAIRFERVAGMWAEDGQCFNDFTTGSLLYSWLGSCVYVVLGRSALVLQLLNAFFGTALILVGMKTMRLLAPRGPQYRYVGWFLALHPSLVLYSAITMREVAVVLSFMVSIYWLVRWRTGGRYMYGPLAIFWAIVSQMFHTGMVIATVAITAMVLYYTVGKYWRGLTRIRFGMRDAKTMVASLAVLMVLALGASIMLNYGYGLEKLQRLRNEGVFEAVSGWQEQVARGRAIYLGGVRSDSLVAVLWQAPLRVIYFIGAPFVWTISRVRDLWGFIDGASLILLSTLIVRQVRRGAWKSRVYRSIAIVVAAVIMGFAVVTSNYGTAFRHRAKFVPVLIVLYVYGTSMGVQRGREDSMTARSVMDAPQD